MTIQRKFIGIKYCTQNEPSENEKSPTNRIFTRFVGFTVSIQTQSSPAAYSSNHRIPY